MIKIKNIQEWVDDVLTTWNELSAARQIWINNRFRKRNSRYDQDWTYVRNNFHVMHLRNCTVKFGEIDKCLLVLFNYSLYEEISNGEFERLEFCQRDHFFDPVICNSIVTPRICYIIDIVHLNKHKRKCLYRDHETFKIWFHI